MMSTGVPARTFNASDGVPHCPTNSKPASVASNRLKPSRNKRWSSRSNSRMGVIRKDTKLRLLFQRISGRCKVNHKRSARMRGVVPKIAPERSHEGAREVKAKSGCVGSFLKRLKELMTGWNSRPIIRNPHSHSILLNRDGDRNDFFR